MKRLLLVLGLGLIFALGFCAKVTGEDFLVTAGPRWGFGTAGIVAIGLGVLFGFISEKFGGKHRAFIVGTQILALALCVGGLILLILFLVGSWPLR